MIAINRYLILFYIAFISFIYSPSLGQTYKISGKVIDAVSREPLPFVNIYLKGQSIGTITDFDGNFSFSTPVLSDFLIASSIGFESSAKHLKKQPEQTIHFMLERANINLDEIVIRPTENPAHIILRKIIANKKKNNNKELDYYSYESYNKVELDLYDWNSKFQDRKVMRPFQFVFDRIDSISEDLPFLPVFLSENLSNYYYRRNPKAEREIIKASKQSGMENESVSQFLGSMYQEVSVYENWPALFSKNFVSPIADNGLAYYKYYLVDSAWIDGSWCYKLNFIPKGKGSFTFIGDMWVADTSFAIKRVSMEAASHVNLNFVDKLSVHQEFAHVNDTLWLMSKDKITVRFKVTNKALGIIGRKTNTYRAFEINNPDNEKHFEDKTDVVVKKPLTRMILIGKKNAMKNLH